MLHTIGGYLVRLKLALGKKNIEEREKGAR